MPTTDIIVLAVVISAFAIFAVALAWGDYQTRNIERGRRQQVATDAHVAALKQGAGTQAAGRNAGAQSKVSA